MHRDFGCDLDEKDPCRVTQKQQRRPRIRERRRRRGRVSDVQELQIPTRPGGLTVQRALFTRAPTHTLIYRHTRRRGCPESPLVRDSCSQYYDSSLRMQYNMVLFSPRSVKWTICCPLLGLQWGLLSACLLDTFGRTSHQVKRFGLERESKRDFLLSRKHLREKPQNKINKILHHGGKLEPSDQRAAPRRIARINARSLRLDWDTIVQRGERGTKSNSEGGWNDACSRKYSSYPGEGSNKSAVIKTHCLLF